MNKVLNKLEEITGIKFDKTDDFGTAFNAIIKHWHNFNEDTKEEIIKILLTE